MDPRFPDKFAHFARKVAERYPWIDAYTPINEPLTTARFSGLYGHWYPHRQDENSFVTILLNELRATVLAMQAIRKVNSQATLIQTEDLGRTYSTPKLRYQADFSNERRWLTWDLLTGAVRPGHRMWDHFAWLRIPAIEVDFFARNPCPPDIVGINYYVTSERYLDEELERYPRELHGQNGRHMYADDAAVRARQIGLAGPRIIMTEAFQRYGLPMAFTEVHLGSTSDEQIRWFMEAWDAAEALRDRGATVLGVTAWALLGSYDWDSLVTSERKHYEPGAFSVENGVVRPTELSEFLTRLARGKRNNVSIPHSPGWWRRRSRLRTHVSATMAA
jgi:dTDP-4-dehydrorhamnose reductase